MAYWITEEKMTSYREHMVQEELAPDTIKKYLRDIRAFAAWLEECAAGRRGKNGEISPGGGQAGAEEVLSGREQPGTEQRFSAGKLLPDDGIHKSEASLEEKTAIPVDKEASTGWKTHLTKAGYAPSTINAMLSSLNGFFEFLGWEECRVKFLKIQRRAFREQEKELSRTEYERLLKTARANGNSRLALLLETICATGIRVSEVKYITVEAFSRRRADISLKGKIRTILLPGKLCKKLRDYARKQNITTGEIFITRKGTGMSRCQIWREMKKLCGKAGVNPSKVFPHNLRHLFARTFYKICRDIVKLADVLGHSRIETTRIYLMSTGENHAQQMEKLGLVS
ncbi:tyrosine-type recombinase/integrase [Acutalibacter muris]|uniref:tyrosine-type recombinase/integrase n=1 Tax=Acutalibacter muris TaxID=1796620 RepID=UPI0025F2C089|nr:tyrosine-type recombinase/integrase [Acutalibacter muris]